MKKDLSRWGVVLCAVLSGCFDGSTSTESGATTDPAARPAGWSHESHEKGAPPLYDSVFPADRVVTLEIVLTDSAYDAMMTDMTALAGEFGSGEALGGMGGGVPADTAGVPGIPPGGMGGDSSRGVPQEAIDAAVGKEVGAACELKLGGMAMSGTVQESNGVKYCGMQGGAGPRDSGQPQGQGGMQNQDGMMEILSGEPIWVPADLKMGGRTWWHVGVRFKGNSSLSNAWRAGSKKLPLRIDADRFEDRFPEVEGERIWGFQKLSLNNASMDSSLVRERLAADLFRGFGVPTPREAFARVVMKHGSTIDTLGLCTLVEIPDDPLLDTWFGSSSGNLYKPEGTGARFTTMVDSAFLVDASDISDIRAMVAALHADGTDSVAWRSAFEKTFDVPVFLKWLAVNTAIMNWDAYGQMAHNFYLYGDRGRLEWIAWDVGLSFQNSNQMSNSIWLDGVDSTWPLIHRLLRDPVYKVAYEKNLRALPGAGFDAAAISGKVAGWKSLLGPYLLPAEKAGFESATSALVDFAAKRTAAVQTELDAAR